MIRTALLAIALLFAAAPALAQGANAAEISFWESVRDSKNPAELRAYLQQYPNGTFKALAEARLAALEKSSPPKAPAVASAAPSAISSATRMPQPGDSWTYRLSYPRLRGQWGQPDRAPSTHVVTVGEAKDGKIVDLLSVDGGSQTQISHSSDAYLVPQGVSILSPYLVAFRDLPSKGSLGTIAILDAPCNGAYGCRATGRILGREKISLPAGEFDAIKVLIDQNWWPAAAAFGTVTFRMTGGRTLTAWYVPELKRAVKFASRLTVGDAPAVDPTSFDLELVSYQVK